MKRVRFSNRVAKMDNLDFDEINGEVNPIWEHKAEALQARKRRDLRRGTRLVHQ